jgi:hypothetical protein
VSLTPATPTLLANSANLTKPPSSIDTNFSLNSYQPNTTTSLNNNNHLAALHNNSQQQQQLLQQNHQQIFTNFIAGQHQQSSNSTNNRSVSNMPKNEPVKLVYPSTQVSTIVTMNNNRVTFTSAPVQNGTISLSPMTANQLTQPNQQQQATVMQRAAGGQQQAPTLIFKNTNNTGPGTLISTPVSKTNSQVSL